MPPSPPRHVHTPTLVCHVPRYQYITERPPETPTLVCHVPRYQYITERPPEKNHFESAVSTERFHACVVPACTPKERSMRRACLLLALLAEARAQSANDAACPRRITVRPGPFRPPRPPLCGTLARLPQHADDKLGVSPPSILAHSTILRPMTTPPSRSIGRTPRAPATPRARV